MSPAYKGLADPSRIISVEKAALLLKSRNTIFVDTRNYWKYVKGHIPGAVDFELYAFHWVDTSKRGLEAFANQMAKLFGSFGIDTRSEVIFYQNNSGYDAARGVWLLEYLGNKNGRLLDGGLNLWKRRGLPLSIEDPKVKPVRFSLSLDDGVLATETQLLKAVRSSERRVANRAVQIVDTRTEGEYKGAYRRASKGGHAPFAVNVDWKKALRSDGALKNAPELLRLYATNSVNKSQETVTYCQSGYRAAHTWFVLKLLGFPRVRNYIGSWYEWGNDPMAPVVQG